MSLFPYDNGSTQYQLTNSLPRQTINVSGRLTPDYLKGSDKDYKVDRLDAFTVRLFELIKQHFPELLANSAEEQFLLLFRQFLEAREEIVVLGRYP